MLVKIAIEFSGLVRSLNNEPYSTHLRQILKEPALDGIVWIEKTIYHQGPYSFTEWTLQLLIDELAWHSAKDSASPKPAGWYGFYSPLASAAAFWALLRLRGAPKIVLTITQGEPNPQARASHLD